MAMITLKGPWKGMDLRETDAEEGTYALGINVDVSQGTIMARWWSIYQLVVGCSFRPRRFLTVRPLTQWSSTLPQGIGSRFQAPTIWLKLTLSTYR